MLRFVVGFAAGWIAKKWLDEEIDKKQVFCSDYGYTDAIKDKFENIKEKFSSGNLKSESKGAES